MAIATTGSLVYGTTEGLGKGLSSKFGQVFEVNGTPAAKLQVAVGSQVVFDRTNSQYYMGLTGSTWIKLGSIA